MDFERSHLGKMNLWQVEHFFGYICVHFWVGATGATATHQKVMTNMLKKVFNWSKVYLSEVTSFKSHISVTFIHYVLLSFNWQLVRHFSDLLQLSHFKWIKHFQRWWEQNRCPFVKWLWVCTANVFSKIIKYNFYHSLSILWSLWFPLVNFTSTYSS